MSAAPLPGDAARVSVFVAVPPATAWEIFTQETDLWWRQGPRFRIAGARRGALGFGPGESGRLFETFGEPPDARTFTMGRILAWQPPLPADHPARHGLTGAAFARMIGLFWGDLLTSFREHAPAPS